MQANDYKVKEAYEGLTRMIEFMENNIPPQVTDTSEEILVSYANDQRSGFIYVHGRDRNFWPAYIMEPQVLQDRSEAGTQEFANEVITASITLIEYMLKHQLLPG